MSSSSSLHTQLRFAASMGKIPHDHTKGPPPKKSKNKGKGGSNGTSRKGGKRGAGAIADDENDDVSLSAEMTEWLTSTFEETDSEGFLKDSLGSMLTRPLDAKAIFCPTASIINSSTAAPKIPANPKTLRETQAALDRSQSEGVLGLAPLGFGTGPSTQLSKVFDEEEKFEPGPTSTELMQSSEFFMNRTMKEHEHPPATFQEAADTLEVMWLKRKAQLEEEEGDLDEAVKTLEAAIEVHLGPEGAQDYSKAKLANPVVASDPMELLNEFEDNFVPYDVKPHAAAERIQRLYRRHQRKVLEAQTLISKTFRGYFYRQIYRRHLYLKAQCAFLIQRRFRAHLARMTHLANMIKGWYKTRGQMRDYVWRLYFYRLVRRIQRRVRGIKGRKLGYIQKFRTTGAISIQRNYRAYRIRRQRFIALAQCHRKFYLAARRIQKRMRIFNAIRKSQGMLVGVSVEEEERAGEEEEIYSEALRIETDKLTLYLKTTAGQLHLKDTKDTINAKDNEFKKIKDTLTKEEIDAHEARVAFELFDTDGSGQIDVDELSAMLTQLCISMDRSEVEELAEEMDADGSGDIDFDEFLDWYSGGQGKQSVGALLFKQVLKARSVVMEVTGVTLEQRARREVLRSVTSWSARDTACMYRMKNPPKFSCCRCLEPFVLFSDYSNHFVKGVQCPVMKQQAVYYPDFSNQTSWTYQRLVEADIVRERDEDPCLVHASMMAIFEELALQQDAGFKMGVEGYLVAAKGMWLEKLQEDESIGLGTHVLNIVDISEEGILPSYIAKIACSTLGHKIPEKWLAEDSYDLETFGAWVKELYPDGKPAKLGLVTRLKNCLTMKKSFEADADKLGLLYFLCLRMLTISTEAQLSALMTLRNKRPRTMTMDDEQLIELGLPNLTLAVYSAKRNDLVLRLKMLQDKMQELVILSLKPKDPCCAYFAKKGEEYAAITPSDLSEEAFRDLRVLDAHNSASARLRAFLKTQAGQQFISRLSSELWARRRLIVSERGNVQGARDSNEIQYKWERLASPVTSEGIDTYDMDLFQQLWSLAISKNDTDKVIRELHAQSSGFIELYPLVRWLTSSKSDPYWSTMQKLKAGFGYMVRAVLARVYSEHAEFKCLALFRKIARLDIELHHKTIKRFIQAAERDGLSLSMSKMGRKGEGEGKEVKEKGEKKKVGSKGGSDKNAKRKKKSESDDDSSKSGKSAGKGGGKSSGNSEDANAKGKSGKKSSSSATDSEDETSKGSKSTKNSKSSKGKKRNVEDPVSDQSLPVSDQSLPAGVESSSQPQYIEDSDDDEEEIRLQRKARMRAEAAEAAAAAEAAEAAREQQMQESLGILKSEFKAAEERLLFRMTENDAEHAAKRRFHSRVGRYQIKHEKMLMRSSGVLFEAYTFCVPPGAPVPAELPATHPEEKVNGMPSGGYQQVSVGDEDGDEGKLEEASEPFQAVDLQETDTPHAESTGSESLSPSHPGLSHANAGEELEGAVETDAEAEVVVTSETHHVASSVAFEGDEDMSRVTDPLDGALEPNGEQSVDRRPVTPEENGTNLEEPNEDTLDEVKETGKRENATSTAQARGGGEEGEGGEEVDARDATAGDGPSSDVRSLDPHAPTPSPQDPMGAEAEAWTAEGVSPSDIPESKAQSLVVSGVSMPGAQANGTVDGTEESREDVHYHHHRLVHTHTVEHNYHHEHIATAWKLAISMWVYTFDTDCSGTFDESECNLLLKFVMRSLDERNLLLQFPEVNKDSASLDTLVEYLVTKVYWMKGLKGLYSSVPSFYVLTMSTRNAAKMLLISLQRQAARDLALQTMATQKGGLGDEEDEKKNDDAVIVRSQMFAMRQVEMFLKTTFGKLHVAVELEMISYYFYKDVRKSNYSKRGLLRYAYQVHRQQHGMLITELPHLIRFLIERLKLTPNENISSIGDMLSSVKSKEDLKMLNVNETIKIVDRCFEDPHLDSSACSTFFTRNAKKWAIRSGARWDAINTVHSKARQQAIQIALEFEGFAAPETNYRCLILGLDALKKKTLKSKIWRGVTSMEIGRDKSINWREVPREATMLLLLARGYCMQDMTLERTERVTGAYHPDGNLADDLVDTESVIFSSRRDEAMNMHIGQSFYRWCRFPFGLPRYLEYKRTVAVLSKFRKEITQIGAMFMKELVEGTSHCGEIEFLEEHVI